MGQVVRQTAPDLYYLLISVYYVYSVIFSFKHFRNEETEEATMAAALVEAKRYMY